MITEEEIQKEKELMRRLFKNTLKLTREDVEVDFDGTVLFNGVEMCDILKYTNRRKALETIDYRDKYKLENKDIINSNIHLPKEYHTTFINEDSVVDLTYLEDSLHSSLIREEVRNTVREVRKGTFERMVVTEEENDEYYDYFNRNAIGYVDLIEAENRIDLSIEGCVDKDDRKFTRIVGGFGEDKPMLTDLQVAELLEYKNGARQVREQINKHIKYFEYDLDIIDFQRVDGKGTLNDTLISLGYSKQAISQAKNIYGFSQSGFLLYLKFAEGDKAVELYKGFIEDYFKTKVDNADLKQSLKEQITFLKEHKANILGRMFMETDELKKIELFNESERISNQIAKLEAQLQSKEDNERIQEALDEQTKLKENKSGYVNQRDFGASFNLKMGSKTVGKILKIVGLAMKNSKSTKPYEIKCPKYAQTIVDQELGRVTYKWNYNECIKVIDKWLKDNRHYEKFYSITNKEHMIKFINTLYDEHITNN